MQYQRYIQPLLSYCMRFPVYKKGGVAPQQHIGYFNCNISEIVTAQLVFDLNFDFTDIVQNQSRLHNRRLIRQTDRPVVQVASVSSANHFERATGKQLLSLQPESAPSCVELEAGQNIAAGFRGLSLYAKVYFQLIKAMTATTILSYTLD